MFLLLVGLLFGAGAIYNFFISGNLLEGTAGIAISLFLLVTYFVRASETKKSREFIEWVENNKENIINGQATYNGIKILPETEVVQFETCMSVLIATFKIPSGYYIKGYHYTSILGLMHTFVSIIFGWWGIPWEPIYTVKVILSNIKGGKKFKIKDILPE